MENINGWSKAPGTYQRKCNEEKSVNTILAAGYREIKIIKHHSYLSGSERSLRHEDVKIFSFSLGCVYVLRDQILSVGHHLSPSGRNKRSQDSYLTRTTDFQNQLPYQLPTKKTTKKLEERNNRSQTFFVLSLIFNPSYRVRTPEIF